MPDRSKPAIRPVNLRKCCVVVQLCFERIIKSVDKAITHYLVFISWQESLRKYSLSIIPNYIRLFWTAQLCFLQLLFIFVCLFRKGDSLGFEIISSSVNASSLLPILERHQMKCVVVVDPSLIIRMPSQPTVPELGHLKRARRKAPRTRLEKSNSLAQLTNQQGPQ